ncbi:MAG: FadR family transcriptional regulator [Bradyrhizobium sp.]|nr:MAG: FadR family transcriptional regulator [Bradyrhizobium sp.]
MKLKIVSNRKLYLQIADQLRDQISTGAAKPGQQLPSERDLAAALGVSRPTVRESLIALEVAGMVDIKVGVGAFVRPRDKLGKLPEFNHSPLETMAVRRLLEPEAAALASVHIADQEKRILNRTISVMRDETARGQWSSESDRLLHMTIADASGNLALREVLETLWLTRAEALDRRFHQHLADIEQIRHRILIDHESIVFSIIEGNVEKSREFMAGHLDFVKKAMMEVWE